MKPRIYYTKPSITEKEIEYATEAATNGWGDRCYEYITRFEEAFRQHLGVKYAIATSSCTGALHLGLAALGVAPGDEVILADINWIASAAPITYLGAKPVFVDILQDSWCIDPKKAEAAITAKTKAIIAVHLYGNLCNMKALLDIGRRHNIPVIEDAAEAIGSVYYGKRAGSLGAFGTFSFHGSKTITTGEGGMFVTNNEELYEKVLTLSNHGRARGQIKQFWPGIVGFKYKMSNIQAAIGCAQMERVEQLIAGKRRIFKAYEQALFGLPVKMNPETEGTINGYWMPTVVFDNGLGLEREKLLQEFRLNNIDGRIFFYPLSSLPSFTKQTNNIISYDIYARAINLPTYHDITVEDIERVVYIIKDIISASFTGKRL
ncbi:MAG: DegT/DnrJ/EryC1/StrS aminotransferase family protein [Elusimicrobiota bacterium]